VVLDVSRLALRDWQASFGLKEANRARPLDDEVAPSRPQKPLIDPRTYGEQVPRHARPKSDGGE
jgi:hypothetical protein